MNRHQWLTTEEAVLRQHYAAKGSRYVADRLGLTPKQVTDRASKLGIKTSHPQPRGRPFTSEDARRSAGMRFRKGSNRLSAES